jgi:gamma-glutamyltranspeptidase / glutathione hydrolase
LTGCGGSHKVEFFMCKRIRYSLSATVLLPLLALALGMQSSGQAPAQQPLEYDREGEITNPQWRAAPVRAEKAMVVSDERLASEAGIEILKKGGNAVDAAVAVAFALAVVDPRAGNIGGGGFMLVRMGDGRAALVDYREAAPQRATHDMYLRPDGSVDPEGSQIGYRASGVPGTVAGLELALRKYGTRKLATVMAPAIRLAEEGFPVSGKFAASLRGAQERLARFSNSRRIFLKDGALYQPGDILRQPELAVTLRRITRSGAAEFYRGATAHDLAGEMAQMGGLITLDDLAAYHAKIRQPLRATYHINGSKWEVITSPPPSSGGIATIEALNILAPVELKGWDDPESVHWVIEAMRRVFADRAAYLGDADFTRVPVKGLTDPRYAAELRATIDPLRASASAQVHAGNPAPFDSAHSKARAGELGPAAARAWAEREAQRTGHTTHFSVVDSAGNAVANTYTLNDSYGSGVTTADGFLLNDEMDDFSAHPGSPNMFGLLQSEANAIGPGKRPLSSMMPTILLRDGRLSFITGSPGGPRIISAVLLTMLNWMRLGLDAQATVNAPRFHQQWMPDVVQIERGLPAALVQDLESRGYVIAPKRVWIGEVEAIGVDVKTGERLGAPDPRREGVALGY